MRGFNAEAVLEVGDAVKRALVVALFVMLAMPAVAEPIDPSDVRVVDGDTIVVYGIGSARVRLVGFNAPETWDAACEPERQLGEKAAQRLRDLVRAEWSAADAMNF